MKPESNCPLIALAGALVLSALPVLPAEAQAQVQAPVCTANSDGTVTCTYPTGSGPITGYPGGQPNATGPLPVSPQTVMRQAVTPRPAMPQAVMPQVVMPQTVVPQTMPPQGIMPQMVMPQGVMPQAMAPAAPGAATAGGTDCGSAGKGLGGLFKGKAGKILGGAMSALCVTGQVAAVAKQAKAGAAAQPMVQGVQGTQVFAPTMQGGMFPGMAVPGAQVAGMAPQAGMMPQAMAPGAAGGDPCAGLMPGIGQGMDSKGAQIFGSALQMMCAMGQAGAAQQQVAGGAAPGYANPGPMQPSGPTNEQLLAGGGYPGAIPGAQPYPAVQPYPAPQPYPAAQPYPSPQPYPAAQPYPAPQPSPHMAYPGMTAGPAAQMPASPASLPPEVEALSLPVNGITDFGG